MVSTFSARVYELATSIPPGRVTTYGILASAAGGGKLAARSITSILSNAPNQGVIPYHRIVYANGKAWLPTHDEAERRQLYEAEDILLSPTGTIQNFNDIVYYFD